MIPYSRGPGQAIPPSSVKIIGLGGAGANMLERIALDGIEGAELLALNSDIRTLGSCIAKEKIQLGVNLTKGLGTGGDPALGQQAVLEAENAIRESLKGCRIVFLCTGLGGGTGSGAAAIVTRIAREEGAFVVVFATMPFTFEGARRREQAETALNELAVLSNALVTFDNNRMGELVLAKQGIHDAFLAADRMICESIKAVIRLVVRPGLINVGLDDLMSALRTNRSRCLFGSGIAEGSDRAAKALRNALASPLLDQGSLLKQAQTVLVHLCGGEDLTLFEIELLMQRLQKFIPEHAHVLFGAAVDPSMGNSLSLTLISALPEDSLMMARRETISHAAPEPPMMEPSQEYSPEPAPDESPKVEKHPPAPARAKPALEPRPLPGTQRPIPEIQAPSLFDENPSALPAKASPVVASFSLASEPAESELPIEPQSPEALMAALPADPIPPAQVAFADVVTEPEIEPELQSDLDADPDEPVTHLPVQSGSRPAIPPWRKPPQPPAEALLTELPASETEDPSDPQRAASEADAPRLKLGIKSATPQSELSLDSVPRGRFEGENPNVFEGEDLDLPPFLRKKK